MCLKLLYNYVLGCNGNHKNIYLEIFEKFYQIYYNFKNMYIITKLFTLPSYSSAALSLPIYLSSPLKNKHPSLITVHNPNPLFPLLCPVFYSSMRLNEMVEMGALGLVFPLTPLTAVRTLFSTLNRRRVLI